MMDSHGDKSPEDAKDAVSTESSDSSLDALLDDALGDFSKPIVSKPSSSPQKPPQNGEWTEEFIKDATKNFETAMREMITKDNISGPTATPGMSQNAESLASEFGKFAGMAAGSAQPANTEDDFAKSMAAALNQISQNSEDVKAAPNPEDVSKMFAGMGLGTDPSNDSNNGFFSLMHSMLENILSKDVLYEPIKEITEKYPDWLANNKCKMSDSEFERYNRQYDIMKQVRHKFEQEEGLAEENKAQHFDDILKLMQHLQDLGQPPEEIAGDCGPALNFNSEGKPSMADLPNLFGNGGFAGLPQGQLSDSPDGAAGSNEQCSLM